MSDRLIKGISRNKELRFFTADVTGTAEKGRNIHNLTPAKAVIFGKLLCAGLLFGADLKEEKYLVTLKTVLQNPEDYIVITANNQGKVRGYPRLNFEEDIMPLKENDPVAVNKKIREQLKALLKDGVFTVIKDIGMKTPYNGSASLITGEIARDITYYLKVSEQVSSIVGLSATLNDDGSFKKAVGFMIQMLPEASDETISLLEKNMQSLPEIIDLLEMGIDIDKIISTMILKNIAYDVSQEIATDYHCDCSKERFTKGLLMLDKKDLNELLKGGESLPLQCRYCNTIYSVSPSEIEKIMQSAR